jgi:hypothetical protein
LPRNREKAPYLAGIADVKKLLAIGLILACSPLASAGPIYSVTLNSLGAGEDVSVQIFPAGGKGLQTVEAFAGVFNMTLNGKSFTTFCIDTAHEVTVGQTYKVQQTPVETGLNYGPQMEYLYAKYVGAAVSNNVEAAALQIALWDLADGGESLLTGSEFRYTDTSSPIYSLANSFIDEALAYTPPTSGSVGDWEDASASGGALGRGQSLIGPPITGFNLNADPVPEPSSLVLAATALGTLVCTRRRRIGARAA